jgi:hypothetical protein
MFFCLPAIFVGFSVSLYAQHTVNDITEYGGWYKVRVEILPPGNTTYFITQCYPSGDEYDVIGDEKEKLPFVFKGIMYGDDRGRRGKQS